MARRRRSRRGRRAVHKKIKGKMYSCVRLKSKRKRSSRRRRR